MESSAKAVRFTAELKKRLNRGHVLSLAACTHCGLCNESCHYYLATGLPEMSPAYKADRLRRIYKRHFDTLGRLIPRWVGAAAIETDEQLQELKDVFFGSCTACRRCTVNCPFGVDMAGIVSLARSLLIDINIAPEGILTVMKDQWETGNQMGISPDEYLETIQWIEEELQAETGDPNAKIPMDKQGAEFLYIVNPREIKYAPLSLQAAAKIFHLAGYNWTMGSSGWDNTNFGLFSGKEDLGAYMGGLAYAQAKKLNVRRLVVSECGHGLRSTKWEAPNWSGARDLPFEIVSVLELVAELIRNQKLVLDPRQNPLPVTYHDPCNLSRSCGMTEEPRFCLQAACLDFREMTPNRLDSLCCTGGGGAMSMTEYARRRRDVSRIKAEQIAATGAAVVATACHNCADGLTDVIREHRLTHDAGSGTKQLLQVRTVCECVGDALVWPESRHCDRRPKTVLVVDDNPDVVAYFSAFLEDEGFQVIKAYDGAEALEKARSEGPDLITLDLAMPVMSGTKLFHRLREDVGGLAAIPVFVVTSLSDVRQLTQGRTVRPPEAVFTKPIERDVLLARIVSELGESSPMLRRESFVEATRSDCSC